MAVPSNTRLTHSAIGMREDLSGVIHDISPTDTPMLSNMGRESCDHTKFEWQTDALAAAATNTHLEGDDSAATAVTETTRLFNYTSIAKKVVQVSGTSKAMDFAGKNNKGELAYHMSRRAQELKRDMEKMICDNVAQVAGGSSTKRVSAGLPAWVASNYHTLGTSSAGTASSGDGSDTATNGGTANAITEAGIKTVLRECFDNGGSPDTMVVGAFNKQAISALTQSVAPLRGDAGGKPATVTAAVDIYVSDFGSVKVITDRFSRARDGWFMDFDYWSICYLRPFKQESLAKTGDSEKRHLVVEWGLKSKNEKSSGFLADLSTS